MLSFAQRCDDGCAIYLFHGVIERQTHAVRNANRKHIEREDFIALLGALRDRRAIPLTMDEVAAHCSSGTPFPPQSFAVTFDDGFENNASIAAPILADFGFPATFYCTTGWVGSTARSWIDRLEACLEHAAAGALFLPWEHDRRLFADAADRISILDVIRAYVKRQCTFDCEALVAGAYAQCGVDEETTWSEPLDRKLSWGQVRALAANPLFAIGGHTHTHAMLAFCPPAEIEEEIAMSARLLRERAGISIRHYAYPEGLAHHYNEDVIARLRAHGVVCCPTAIDGVNTHEADPFHLRRVPVMWSTVPANVR